MKERARKSVPGMVGLVLGLVVSPAAGERGAVVREGLRLHAMQESATWGQHGIAFGRAVEGMVTAEAEAARELEHSRAERAHSPFVGVCEAVDGFRAMSAGRAGEARETQAAGDALVAWLGLDRALAPELTGGSDGKARVEEVLGRYCARGRARGAGGACTGAPEDHGRDLHPGALLEAGTLEEGDDAIAAMDWIRNVAVPVLEEPPAMTGTMTAGERRRVLSERSIAARAAVAAGYLQGRAASRVPSVPAGDWVEAVSVERDGSVPDVVSRHELLRVLARGRYEDPNHLSRLQAADRANLLREWISAEVVSLALGFEGYRDDERRLVMLAARLSGAVERARREER